MDGIGMLKPDLCKKTYKTTVNEPGRFFYSLLVISLLVSVSFITIIPASASPFGESTNYGYINAIIARKVILDEPWGTDWNPEQGVGGNWETGVSVSQFVYVVVISNNGFPIKGANVSGFYTAANGSTNLFPFSGTTDAEGEFNASKSLDNQVRIGQTSNTKGPNEGGWNVTINVTYKGTTTSLNRHFVLGEYGCGRSGSGCHAPGGSVAGKGSAMGAYPAFSHDPYISGVSADGTTQSAHQVYSPSGDAHEAPRGTTAGTNCETCHRAYNQDFYNTTNAYLNNATALSGNGLHEANGIKCKDCHKNATIGGVVQTRYEVPQCYDAGCHTNTVNVPKTWVQSRTDSYSWNQHAHDTNQTIACIFCHGPFHNNTKPNNSVPLVANGVTESENCANNCHKNQVYHNATVQCTVCHSQAAHEIRYFNSTGGYTYNKTQSPGGLNVGRKYAGKCSTCHQKPYFARLLNNSNDLSDPYDAANGSYSKGPGGVKLVSDPLGHSNAQNNGSKWGNYWNAGNDSDSCIYCHGNVYTNVNYTFTEDALGHVWQFMGNNVVNGSISSSSYWCASCHWQGYSSGGKTYNDMVSSFLSDNDPVPPEITGNATYGANQSVPGYRNHNGDGKTDASCKGCHGSNLSTGASITDFMHNLSIGSAGGGDTTPPASVINLQNTSYAQTYINWVWTDPADADFANVMIYLNGIFQSNISKGNQSYNATGLNPSTAYNLNTRTVDTTGNINTTWVNHTARTAPVPTYIPPAPSNLASTQGNFWVNYTWQAGAGNNTDSYNVSVNGIWTNGTNSTYSNSSVGAHNWSNITVFAYNSSGSGSLSLASALQNTRVANNVPVQSPIGNKAVSEGELLTFTVSATDADSDAITYSANATKGTLNPTTGIYSWTPGYADAGIYVWEFNSSDNYGGVAREVITVTVTNVPLAITSSTPVSDPTTTAGTAQTFAISLNRTATVTWYINGSVVQTNSSVASASYTNSTAGIGINNVTASASDGIDSSSRKWNWTVSAIPAYNVSGYVFDNYGTGLGRVLVQNGSNQTSTQASGYYLITGMYNGTYNFSYSKSGFNPGYLEVTINGADVINANKTIYDTTPPVQVTGLTNDTPARTTVNLSWDSTAGANYYQVFRDSISLGYTSNVYWNDTGLTSNTLYQYWVRANDSYNNWGQNSTVLNVRTASAVDTIPPAGVTNLMNTSFARNYINWTWTDPADPDFDRVMVYLNGAYQNDVLKGVQYFNASVSPGTYTIGTRTVDTTGNVNATMVTHTATTILPSVRYINGTVMDSITKAAIQGVTVFINPGVPTTTNASGFYSFAVTEGTYNLTARLDPAYYTNSTVTVSTAGSAVVVQDIELVKKPTGTITGRITTA